MLQGVVRGMNGKKGENFNISHHTDLVIEFYDDR